MLSGGISLTTTGGVLERDVLMFFLKSRHDRESFVLPAVANVRALVCRGPM
jgi:hypothetical protein